MSDRRETELTPEDREWLDTAKARLPAELIELGRMWLLIMTDDPRRAGPLIEGLSKLSDNSDSIVKLLGASETILRLVEEERHREANMGWARRKAQDMAIFGGAVLTLGGVLALARTFWDHLSSGGGPPQP